MRNPGRLLGAGLLSTVLLVGGTVPTLAYVQKEKLAASGTLATTPEVIAKIDQILLSAYPATAPGAAVLISKDGKVIFRKGYGLADVEKKVPIQPDMIFRLGSITKQFTAAGILLLVEQGKISLDDEISKFLPEYPTRGKKITIEHLLTHTSGIKSYTGMGGFRAKMQQDTTPIELVDFFKNEPMDFDPGTEWRYNNSGYVLLGVIIEKVSGKSYGQYVYDHIFKPLGMKHSFYGTEEASVPNRALGHSGDGKEVTYSAPMSMTLPYAAGALLSNVDDLAIWNRAMASGKLLKPATWKRAFTPYVLSNGKPTTYGYGLEIEQLHGEEVIQHGGGINGFVTMGYWLPKQNIFIAILTNSDSAEVGPSFVTRKVAATLIGKPYKEYTAITLDAKKLDEFVGVYQISNGATRTITRQGNQLYAQRTGGQKMEIFPASESEVFYKNSFTVLKFVRDEAGKIVKMIKTDEKGEEPAVKTDQPVPKEREVAKVDPAIYDAYVGEYELAPGFVLTVTRDGGKLFTQATGQQQIEIFPESETKFFLKVVDAQLTFVKDADGKVNQVILHQGGRNMPAKRIK